MASSEPDLHLLYSQNPPVQRQRHPIPPELAIAGLDVVLIQQHVEILEVICGCHMPNSYSLRDDRGFEFMRCSEDTDGCCGCCGFSARVACMGNHRGFVFTLQDPSGHEFTIERTEGFTCPCPFGFCCLNRVEVTMGQTVCGYVQQQVSCCGTVFEIQDAQETPVLKVIGPAYIITCCSDVEFRIESMDGVRLGGITRKYPGFFMSRITAADNFVVRFPIDLDTELKLVLVGATLLVDFLFFENIRR